jgi:hypothetical protein
VVGSNDWIARNIILAKVWARGVSHNEDLGKRRSGSCHITEENRLAIVTIHQAMQVLLWVMGDINRLLLIIWPDVSPRRL